MNLVLDELLRLSYMIAFFMVIGIFHSASLDIGFILD